MIHIASLRFTTLRRHSRTSANQNRVEISFASVYVGAGHPQSIAVHEKYVLKTDVHAEVLNATTGKAATSVRRRYR